MVDIDDKMWSKCIIQISPHVVVACGYGKCENEIEKERRNQSQESRNCKWMKVMFICENLVSCDWMRICFRIIGWMCTLEFNKKVLYVDTSDL